MDAVKICGALLVFVFCFGTGFNISACAVREKRECEGLLSLIRCISSRVTYFRAPLGDIYASFDEASLRECGFLGELRAKGWEAAIKRLTCNTKIRETLSEFGADLGRSGSDETQNACAVCESILEEELAKIKAALPGRTRVSKTLGITAGILALILII